MENTGQVSQSRNNQVILKFYLGICAILILFILATSFQRTDLGALEGEIYLRPASGEVNDR
jgi:hypothetical protein